MRPRPTTACSGQLARRQKAWGEAGEGGAQTGVCVVIFNFSPIVRQESVSEQHSIQKMPKKRNFFAPVCECGVLPFCIAQKSDKW
jgi:hypothetical protein